MAKKKAAVWSKWPILIIEVFGYAIAFYLFLVSARVISPEAMPCPSQGIFACTSIVRGKYSYIGPFSIAALGTLYFMAQIVLTAVTRAGNLAAFLKGLMILGGYAFLGWLRATEIVYLHKICPWCYAVCFLTLCEAIALWPALTVVLPPWKLPARTVAVFGSFILVSIFMCLPVLLCKSADNAFGRQWFPFKYPALDGGVAIEHDIDLMPVGKAGQKAKYTPVPIFTPESGAASKSATAPATAAPAAAVTATPAATPVKKPPEMHESSRDTEETRVLRANGWRVVGDNESVLTALRHHSPVFLLAFDPICEECTYLIVRQLSSPVMADVNVMKVAVEYTQLRGSVATVMNDSGMPKMALVAKDGTVLWSHVGRMDASEIVKQINAALKK